MTREDRNSIVADGRRRIVAGPRYQTASHALRHKMKRRCAPLLAKSSLVGKLIIHFRICRCVQRQLDKIAPPQGFYAQCAVRRSRFTSNRSLQLTPFDCRSHLRPTSAWQAGQAGWGGPMTRFEFMKHIVDPFDFAQDRSLTKARVPPAVSGLLLVRPRRDMRTVATLALLMLLAACAIPVSSSHDYWIFAWSRRGTYHFALVADRKQQDFLSMFDRHGRGMTMSELEERLTGLPKGATVSISEATCAGIHLPPAPISDELQRFAAKQQIQMFILPSACE